MTVSVVASAKGKSNRHRIVRIFNAVELIHFTAASLKDAYIISGLRKA